MTRVMVLANKFAFVFLLGVFFTGCADWVGAKPPNEVLAERTNERWAALIKKDWNAAYQFELPAYRETHDINKYQAKFGNKLLWKTVKVDNVTVNPDGETANVRLTLTYEFPMPGVGMTEGNSQVNERWLKQDNIWWMVD